MFNFFFQQGVDLSNIIKDLTLDTGEEHLVSAAVKKLKELSSTEQNEEHVADQLDILMVRLVLSLTYIKIHKIQSLDNCNSRLLFHTSAYYYCSVWRKFIVTGIDAIKEGPWGFLH